jgi:hypothetical protein
MTTEEVNTEANNQWFVDELKGAFANRIVLALDLEPSFNKDEVPFQFEYSSFLYIVTDKGNFRILNSQTDDTTCTFWTQQVDDMPGGNKIIEVESTVNSIELKTARGSRYPFKLAIRFENREVFIYCAEIYETWDDTLRYVPGDEMFLVFDKQEEAMKFETLINFG